MIMFGYSTLAGNRSALTTASYADINTGVSIQNAIYDQLFADDRTTLDTTGLLPTMQDWDYATMFNAMFDGTLKAGNFLFTASEILSVRLKRAEADSYNWITLAEIPVAVESDLGFTLVDFLARGNQEYKYALVPVKIDGTEGAYNVNTVESNFDGIWVCEKDIGYNGLLDLELSSTLNQVTSNVVTIGRRYPYVNKYGKANYYTGNFTTTFIHMSTTDCSLDLKGAVKYREEVEAYLTNGLPKIIKHMDGRIWLAMITDEISKEEGDGYWLPMQTVNFTEIGRHDSSSDLYQAGLIDVNIETEVSADELLS